MTASRLYLLAENSVRNWCAEVSQCQFSQINNTRRSEMMISLKKHHTKCTDSKTNW